MPDDSSAADYERYMGYDQPEPFYAEALPCESCGAPTSQPRVWDEEHQIWLAYDCHCNSEEQPRCPIEIRLIEAASGTLGEMHDQVMEHRKSCPVCLGVRKGVASERGAGELDERRTA